MAVPSIGDMILKTRLLSLLSVSTGYGPGYDDVVVHGDLEDYKFVAYYTK